MPHESDAVLTRERVLDAAEDVLRRFGPPKATVVDVARALGVSHGSVYRHFPSKAALRDAVAERWLSRVSQPLAAIAAENGPAPERLRRWLDTLIAFKRRKVLDDPEMFANYLEIAAGARDVVKGHVEALSGQVAQIIRDGMNRGEFAATDPSSSGKAIFEATARFHHPAHAREWTEPDLDSHFEAVWALLLRGLTADSRA
ncbi:MAG TPA: TetR family transcriptional regulator [Bryobacteraceae bacterium]|nr:TetR family transcriptional regulator [Bryobacteraceae bacterium]